MGRKSKYRHVCDEIRKEIDAGNFPDGAKIATENEMMERFYVSRQTIRRAIEVLTEEGLLQRRQGSGTYIKRRRALRSPTKTVGLIGLNVTEYIFPMIVESVEKALFEKGYRLNLSVTQNRVGYEREILLSYIKSPVDALLVEGSLTALPNPNLNLYRQLRQMGVPIVFYNGYYKDLEDTVHVTMDHYDAAFKATQYFASLGHKRIGAVLKCDEEKGLQQYRGYLDSLISLGMPIRDNDISLFTTDHIGKKYFKEPYKLVERFFECTAILCFNDITAHRLISALNSEGIKVPDDISVMGIDNCSDNETSFVPLTSMEHAKGKMGRIAVEKVLGLINGEDVDSEQLEFKIVKRESTRKVE